MRRPKKDCNSISRYICTVLVSHITEFPKENNTYSNPLISDNVVNCESFLWISLQHAFNEIFCVFGNLKKSKQLFLIIIACPKKKFVKLSYRCSISRNFYLSPFRIGKFISSWPNSLFHSRRNGQTVVTVKWRETTQPEKINR